LAASFDQDHQNVERSAADRDEDPIGKKFAPVRVQTKAAKLHGRRIRRLAHLFLSDHKHFLALSQQP
jgi:hypothetical protein